MTGDATFGKMTERDSGVLRPEKKGDSGGNFFEMGIPMHTGALREICFKSHVLTRLSREIFSHMPFSPRIGASRHGATPFPILRGNAR